MDDKQDSKDQGVEYSTQGSSQATIEPLHFMSIVDLTENGEQSQGTRTRRATVDPKVMVEPLKSRCLLQAGQKEVRNPQKPATSSTSPVSGSR